MDTYTGGPKPAKFSLVVNSQQQDGFKLSFSAEDKETLQIFQSLTEKLIEKITKIEIKVQEYE